MIIKMVVVVMTYDDGVATAGDDSNGNGITYSESRNMILPLLL